MTKHMLEPLPYAYDALEPYIDQATMRIHHDKHHQAYVDNLNKALEEHPQLQEAEVEDLLRDLDLVPPAIRDAIRNHGGGHANHRFFWTILKAGVPLSGDIADAIVTQYGSHDAFKAQFAKAALGRFGSGWVWLVLDRGHLEIVSTANQDSPLSLGKAPLLAVDVWEHAYYLKYQNRRADYVEALFHVIDWQRVNELYVAARARERAGVEA
jgi:Fe-Mn family superoxide dismutase